MRLALSSEMTPSTCTPQSPVWLDAAFLARVCGGGAERAVAGRIAVDAYHGLVHAVRDAGATRTRGSLDRLVQAIRNVHVKTGIDVDFQQRWSDLGGRTIWSLFDRFR